MNKLNQRVNERSYYDYFPPSVHAPGDIWMHLPTHGLLRRDDASALVVTPSCDLYNRKVSTITYLPIISFLDWIGCQDFLPEVCGAMSSIAEQVNQIDGFKAVHNEGAFNSDLEKQLVMLEEKLASEQFSNSLRKACERYVAGGKHLRRVSIGQPADVRDLELCLARNRWEHIRSQIIRNVLRSDLYFLPADGNDTDMSPIPKHSLVLFRYPLTIPVAVLDLAQNTSLSEWTAATSVMVAQEPMARAFSGARPLKCLRLQDRFLSDLLTKFVAVYSRLGSPDFSQDTVAAISRELGEA